MFLHLSFMLGILSRRGSILGGLCPGGVSVQAIFVQGSLSMGSLSRGISVQGEVGVSVQGRYLSWGVSVTETSPIWKRAGGAHPTGMLSCLITKTTTIHETMEANTATTCEHVSCMLPSCDGTAYCL